MCSLNRDPPLFLPPMVNSESAVVWLLPFHTWLHKTCGRVAPRPLSVFVCPCMTVWWNIEVFYHRPLGRRRHDSCPLILFFRPSLSRRRGFIFSGVACRSGRQTSSGPMTELIHRSCRMKRPFGVNPFQRASMESFSQMPVPFAALTVLEYDEKGLGRVQWLSYVYCRWE